jgi:lambda repressor-like predicted transcriptional regulator
MMHSPAETCCGPWEEQERIYADFAEKQPQVSYNESFAEESKKMNQRTSVGTEKRQMYK